MKRLTLLTSVLCFLPVLANAAEIQLTGTLEEDKKGKAKVEGFRGCPDRDVLKRSEGMGHTDLKHGTLCDNKTNICTLSMTIPQGTPLPVYYYELDDAGQCVQKELDLSIVTNATEYYGDIKLDESQLAGGYDAISTGMKSQNGEVMSKMRAGTEIRVRFQYEQPVTSDTLPLVGDTLQIQY